ncbi:MAG: hypothetical protein R3C05_00920 [Pirellulaceae bacterium]
MNSDQDNSGRTQEATPAPQPEEAVSEGGLVDTLLFGLSLPERSARTVSAILGGFASETAARLIPSAFRSSQSYTVFIQQSLNFMIHDVGGVVSNKPADATNQAEGLLGATNGRRDDRFCRHGDVASVADDCFGHHQRRRLRIEHLHAATERRIETQRSHRPRIDH